jgi:nucleotide-binding universal stress UspA family protein
MKSHHKLSRILVPVPLNSNMNIPLQQALQFSKVFESEIVLLNVVPEYSIFHKLVKPNKLIKRKKVARQKLEKLAKAFFKGNIPKNVSIKVVKGTLISAILKYAADLKCDLIIIKKAKRLKSFFNQLKAENADKLISEATCPVLTISSSPTAEKIQTIMIPVDIFKAYGNKVAWSILLAGKLGAKIHLVSVLKTNISLKNSLAYKRSKEIEDVIKSEGIEVSKTILEPSGKTPEQAVLEHAEEVMPDMLLMMTHKESVLLDNYLGSFARELIHNCSLPIFSLVPRKELLLEGFIKTIPSRQITKINQQVNENIKL